MQKKEKILSRLENPNSSMSAECSQQHHAKEYPYQLQRDKRMMLHIFFHFLLLFCLFIYLSLSQHCCCCGMGAFQIVVVSVHPLTHFLGNLEPNDGSNNFSFENNNNELQSKDIEFWGGPIVLSVLLAHEIKRKYEISQQSKLEFENCK
jgi:hypothetical protein